MRMWLAVVLGLSFAACYAEKSGTSPLHEDSAQAAYEENCQTLLSPAGPIEGEVYSTAVFSQRSCKGKAKAVTKMVRASDLVLVTGSGDKIRSKLYADGMDVQVKTKEGLITIGTLEETTEGLELVLKDAIRVELMMGSDIYLYI